MKAGVLQPIEIGGASGLQGGHYRFSDRVTGLTGTAANAPLLSFRWMNTVLALVVHFLKLNSITTTAFTTAQAVDYAVNKATGFSASDTGGSVIVPNPKRSGLPIFGAAAGQGFVAGTDYDLRIGALTAGTRTLAADPLAIRGEISTSAPPLDPIVFDIEHEGNLVIMPAVSAALAEGLEVTLLTALGAAGVLNFYAEMAFSVVPPAALGF